MDEGCYAMYFPTLMTGPLSFQELLDLSVPPVLCEKPSRAIRKEVNPQTGNSSSNLTPLVWSPSVFRVFGGLVPCGLGCLWGGGKAVSSADGGPGKCGLNPQLHLAWHGLVNSELVVPHLVALNPSPHNHRPQSAGAINSQH